MGTHRLPLVDAGVGILSFQEFRADGVRIPDIHQPPEEDPLPLGVRVDDLLLAGGALPEKRLDEEESALVLIHGYDLFEDIQRILCCVFYFPEV